MFHFESTTCKAEQSRAHQIPGKKERKTKQSKTKQKIATHNKAQQTPPNIYLCFSGWGPKKTNRNHASRWRHGPDKEELANHEVSCDSKFQPAQHLAKAQKKQKKHFSSWKLVVVTMAQHVNPIYALKLFPGRRDGCGC